MPVAVPTTIASAFSVIEGTRKIIPTRTNMADNTAVCPRKSICLITMFSLIQLLSNNKIYLDTCESFYK